MFDEASHHPWWRENLDNRFTPVATMLSDLELKMLVWLARRFPLEDDTAIVDAGCFLGGSTLALALGLRDNPTAARKQSRIIAYDRFDPGNDQAMRSAARSGVSVSDDYLIQFRANLADLGPYVTTVCGDFHHAPPPEGRIGILFVDIAKTWSLNQRVVSEYFSRLYEGSVVVQQDHNDHCCPWIGLTMEHFSDYFEFLFDERSSRVYRVIKQPPREALEERLESLPHRRHIELMERSRLRPQSDVSRYMSAVAQAWLIHGHEGGEAAQAYLDTLPPQPWESATPYVDNVRSWIRGRDAKSST